MISQLSPFQLGIIVGYAAMYIMVGILPYLDLIWSYLEFRFHFYFWRTISAIVGILGIVSSLWIVYTLHLLK